MAPYGATPPAAEEVKPLRGLSMGAPGFGTLCATACVQRVEEMCMATSMHACMHAWRSSRVCMCRAAQCRALCGRLRVHGGDRRCTPGWRCCCCCAAADGSGGGGTHQQHSTRQLHKCCATTNQHTARLQPLLSQHLVACRVAPLLTHQEAFEGLEVCDDAVVHHHKLVGGARHVRVGVEGGGGAVGGPSRVRNAAVHVEHIGQVDLRAGGRD